MQGDRQGDRQGGGEGSQLTAVFCAPPPPPPSPLAPVPAQMASFRTKGRIPVAEYVHINGASICRSGQPKVHISVCVCVCVCVCLCVYVCVQ